MARTLVWTADAGARCCAQGQELCIVVPHVYRGYVPVAEGHPMLSRRTAALRICGSLPLTTWTSPCIIFNGAHLRETAIETPMHASTFCDTCVTAPRCMALCSVMWCDSCFCHRIVRICAPAITTFFGSRGHVTLRPWPSCQSPGKVDASRK